MTPLEVKFRTRLENLPERYRWSLHNIVGHPLSEIFNLLGADELSDFVHRITLPLPSKTS